jgi:hypothetical protein
MEDEENKNEEVSLDAIKNAEHLLPVFGEETVKKLF